MFTLRKTIKRVILAVIGKLAPVRYKNYSEMRFWRGRYREEGRLAHGHYEYFYTEYFNLSREDYSGKRVLDIGCGPRGSLEWIAEEAECIGIDPLIPQYRELGIDNHLMKYVHASVEDIPFPDGHFHIVTTFNNLDHVDDVDKAIAEIKRVTGCGGTLLLITEVEHEASATEPQNLPRSIANWFEPEFRVVSQGICAIRSDHNVYLSLRDNAPFVSGKEGIVYARLARN